MKYASLYMIISLLTNLLTTTNQPTTTKKMNYAIPYPSTK